MSLQTLNHPKPFTLWTCESCDHTWWALKPERKCPDCESAEIASFDDYPEQPKCDICNRDWRVAPVVKFGCCEQCWEDKR